MVRRHRAALLKFAELAGAAGVDAVVQASKPPSPPLPTGKPGAGACVAVQAAQGPRPGGLGQHAPQRRSALGAGRESLPGGPPGRAKEGYNLLYPVVSTCFSKQVLDHPNNRKRRYFLLL